MKNNMHFYELIIVLFFLIYFINFRTAIQCENGTSYDSCIPRCSQNSCDDYTSQKKELCNDKICIEGKFILTSININILSKIH
jgi:hypothetical protein